MRERKVIQIFHAERHSLFRSGVKKSLKGFEIEVIGEADGAKEIIERLVEVKQDLLLTSHKLYDEEADVFLPKVKEKFPDLKIMMLTIVSGKDYLVNYINYLNGMLTKRAKKKELIKAIRLVVNGDLYFHLS